VTDSGQVDPDGEPAPQPSPDRNEPSILGATVEDEDADMDNQAAASTQRRAAQTAGPEAAQIRISPDEVPVTLTLPYSIKVPQPLAVLLVFASDRNEPSEVVKANIEVSVRKGRIGGPSDAAEEDNSGAGPVPPE
jgi:hypothetical protein